MAHIQELGPKDLLNTHFSKVRKDVMVDIVSKLSQDLSDRDDVLGSSAHSKLDNILQQLQKLAMDVTTMSGRIQTLTTKCDAMYFDHKM